jgi:hypothetical protein
MKKRQKEMRERIQGGQKNKKTEKESNRGGKE